MIPAVKVEDIVKKYKSITAVNNISLEINKGDIYGILGPNGAGKTTVISMILGLVKPNSGSIEVLGQKINQGSNRALSHVGALVGDTPPFYPYMSGKENVEYMAKLFKMPPKKVDETLEFMGLSRAADRKPTQYSTGMKQRLGIAMAIVHEPEILILDEPTNGMDPGGMREIRTLIQELAKRGITVILCSHLLNEVEQVCNRVAIFKQGQIVAQGRIEDLMKNTGAIMIETYQYEKTLAFLTQCEIEFISEDPGFIHIKSTEPEKLIEQLVAHQLTPRQVFDAGQNLENLYLELIDNEVVQ